MDVYDALCEANAVLADRPANEAGDWHAVIAVGEFVESDAEPIWELIRRWANSLNQDTRAAMATCLVEHLLEYHFVEYFPKVERLAVTDPLFADTFSRCWQFGQSEHPGNSERFKALKARLLLR